MANINQNRWDQLVRRVGGLIGPGSKVNNTIGDLFPMLDVENLPGELYYLMGTFICYGGQVQGPVAAEFPRIQIMNPADSGLLITVTGFTVSTETGQELRWDINSTALASAAGNGRVRDTRVSTDQIPTGQIRTDSSGSATTLTGITRVLVNQPFTLHDENGIAVLAPGSGFQVGGTTANSRIRVTFYWRERVAEASELQF